MRPRFSPLCAAMLALLVASAAAANLTSNPSFEVGPSPGVVLQLPVGSTSVTGWVVTRNPIEYIGTRWDSPDGVRNISLNGTGPGGIAQTIATVPSQRYTVTFWMGGDALANPIIKHMRVTANGQSQDYEFDATHSWEWNIGWLQKSFSFTATGTSTTLEFYSLDAGEQGPAIDQVEIQETTSVPFERQRGFELSAAPNPSSVAFDLRIYVPSEAPVRISVWDVAGRVVRVIADHRMSPGGYLHRWDGNTPEGRAAAGLYIVRLDAPGVSLSRKVMLTR